MRRGLILGLLICNATWGGEERIEAGRELFDKHCGVCHSLDLPRSQRLDRATWEWVISDMIDQYGASWITEEEQKRILDYLVEVYGPEE